MKLIKRIAAMGSAVMMAIMGMAMSTNAATSGNWRVYTAPGTSGLYSYTVELSSSNYRNTVYESCSKYSSTVSGTYAKMNTYAVDYNNNIVPGYTLKNGDVHISSTHSNTGHTLNGTAAPTLNIKVKFDLVNYGTYSEIKGTASNN